MASALKQYAQHLLAAAKHEAAMKELRKDAKKELNAIPDKITTIDGVKFHITSKLKETIYPESIQKIIDDLLLKIKDQKENAEKSNLVTKKYKQTFDAEILEKEK
ncbi:MAG: hypothetical protein HYV29_01675 [Ignavibacteriales bacterium]|nr:hypothetical protein [Ignavibacteriales bacterium]